MELRERGVPAHGGGARTTAWLQCLPFYCSMPGAWDRRKWSLQLRAGAGSAAPLVGASQCARWAWSVVWVALAAQVTVLHNGCAPYSARECAAGFCACGAHLLEMGRWLAGCLAGCIT